MVKGKEKKVIEISSAKRSIQVPKLDKDAPNASAPSDFDEMINLWGDEAKELLQRRFNSVEDALSCFVDLMLKRSELSARDKESERKFLMDMLSNDQVFQEELRVLLKF